MLCKNSKWIIDLNAKHKTIKLEDIRGENLNDPGFGDDFLNTLDFIKLKTSILQKTQSREWEDKTQTARKYLQKLKIFFSQRHGFAILKLLDLS